MDDSAGVAALRMFTAQRTRSKKQQVAAAIQAQCDAGVRVTVSGIARDAAVSREFIYEHAELLAAVKRARTRPPAVAGKVVDPSSREQALVAEKTTLIAKVRQQAVELEDARGKLEELSGQRERWLGAQLDQMMQPARVEELVAENGQLTRRLFELTRLCETQQRSIKTLEEELRIARLAHAETAAELLGESSRVVAVLRPRATAKSDSPSEDDLA